jgi:hypothetical protein
MLFLCLLLIAAPSALHAQRTDIVIMKNGDRITGEIRKLERGRLEYKTDDMKTLEIEWLKIDKIESTNIFDIESVRGRRYRGSIGRAEEPGRMIVHTATEPITLDLSEIVRIDRLWSTFWKRIRGYLDLGLSYQKANNQVTWTLGGEANYRTVKWASSLIASSYFRNQAETRDTRRNDLSLAMERIFENRWTGLVLGSLEQNDELDLDFRASAALAFGRYIVQSNSSLLLISAGFNATQEKLTTNAAFKTNAEALLSGRIDAFRFVRPELDFTLQLMAFPSLTEKNRVRLNLDSRLRYEIFKDFFITVSVFDHFDGFFGKAADSKNDFGFDTKVTLSFR